MTVTNLTLIGETVENILDEKAVPHHGELHGLCLAEEAGEACRAIVKGLQGIRGTTEFWEEELRKELGDVVMAATGIAAHYGIDLDEAVAERLHKFITRTDEEWATQRR